MKYLSLKDILSLYEKIIQQSGGSYGIRDMNLLKSSVAQPFMTYDCLELYPTLIDKACALGYSLIMNHPFIDGNKRIGHASLELFLYINGYEILASVDEQEKIILSIASGKMSREAFKEWINKHLITIS